jgi:Spy/CpxP family protein refolding chaperone
MRDFHVFRGISHRKHLVIAAGLLAILLALVGCSDDTTTTPSANDGLALDESLFDAYEKMGVSEFNKERGDRWEWLAEMLGLSEEQVDQLQAAFSTLHTSLMDLREAFRAGEMTREEAREQVTMLVAEFEAALQEILTPEQLELLSHLRLRHREHERHPRLGGCFELVFPVTFIMPDDSTIVVEDREGFADLKAWYEENPDVTEHPALQYPVEISYKDGQVVTINSDEEMRQAKEDCGDYGRGGGRP